jgi:hypothetical protein
LLPEGSAIGHRRHEGWTECPLRAHELPIACLPGSRDHTRSRQFGTEVSNRKASGLQFPDAPHQFRTRNGLIETQQARLESNKTKGKSIRPIVILPLITVWLQVRVLPGPPVSDNPKLFGFSSACSMACSTKPRFGNPGLIGKISVCFQWEKFDPDRTRTIFRTKAPFWI